MKRTFSRLIQNPFTCVLFFCAFFFLWDYGWEYFLNDNILDFIDTILHRLFIGVFVGMLFYFWNIKPELKEINKK
ncbi:hypothetical protein [Salegentibacter mishustinae]|uniref:hypothetical protein n=1 Tax=Salegentibacter mishustinae TaxID=270918 RepID=UPI002491EE2F|nr:hypothetical protein [Salegentibacter mishustinae]